jgi:hypothetical protein
MNLHQRKLRLAAATALAVGGLIATRPASAQSSEALLDILVRKGILTEQESEDVKSDLTKENKQFNKLTVAGKTVGSLNLYGDFRGRYEGFFQDDPAFVDRNRFRYRLRAGLTYKMVDQFEVGFRLTSSEAAGGFGGDPVSGNTTFSGDGSKKFVYIDLAYGKWTPILMEGLTNSFTIGKMENPFTFPSTLVFDKDYTPEGLALDFSYGLNPEHTVKFAAGGFALNEIGASSNDPFLVGSQLRWEAAWTPKLSSSAGVGLFAISGKRNLKTADVPNQNRGNTRTAAGDLVHNYNPLYADAGVTYLLDRFPFYGGPFPITVSGDFLHNPGAPDANNGYSVGLVLGKSGKKGAWDFTYRWTELQADAWYEETTESDFGAWYRTAPVGGGAGYGAGTNVRGHWFKVGYSLYDSLTLNVAYFMTDLINESPAGPDSGMGRLQVDANWKF